MEPLQSVINSTHCPYCDQTYGNHAKGCNKGKGLTYSQRVEQLENEGMTTSDAQGIVDTELRFPK